MMVLQLSLIGAFSLLLLLVHRAGVPRTLRAVGAFFWSLAAGYEKAAAEMKSNFSESMKVAREMERRA